MLTHKVNHINTFTMSKGSEAVKRWRRNTKTRAVESMGGECCVCGYNKCQDAMEFHHLNPSEKEAHFGQIRGNIKGWNTIVQELRKCVLLCSNCHKEFHAGLIALPDNPPRFDEKFADYKSLQVPDLMEPCPICGGDKPKHQRTCSYKCAAKLRGSIDWSNIDVVGLLQEHGSFEAVGRELNCSGAAVHRRHKKLIPAGPQGVAAD